MNRKIIDKELSDGKMKKYSIYGLILESDMDFIQLEPMSDELVDADNNVVTIRSADIANEVLEELEGSPVNYKISFTKSCFKNSKGFYLIKNGNEILYEPNEDFSDTQVAPFIIGYCLAMALLQRNILAVHCSAVCLPNGAGEGAILISGEPGAGKSSVTRKLVENGYGIMADDVAAVREGMVYPAFPYQKLCRNEVEKRNLATDKLIYIDEDKDKFLVPVNENFVSEPQKLKGMIFMTAADVSQVQMERLSGINQLFAFKHNLFLHRFTGEWLNDPNLLNLCLKTAGDCPVYMVVRPQNGDFVSEIAEIISNIEM